MNYLDQQRFFYEDSFSYPDKAWVIMDFDNDTPVCFEDRYEAEQYYWSLKDDSVDVKFGYCWKDSFTGSTPFKEVERLFKEVRL